MNFKIGLGIEVVRVLLGNVGLLQRQPLQIFQKLLDMNTGLIVFLVGYTTVYRVSSLPPLTYKINTIREPNK